MGETDTIAAIATSLSQSGIGIIRVSGPRATEAVNEIFVPKKEGKDIRKVKSHTIHYGAICGEEGVLDEVLISVMRAPNSYTTEDVVEINCHGGVFVVRRVLAEVCNHGVRPAEPGEFTKRAFLNGRIDLAQAEAVMDVISAESEDALKSSVGQLRGSISEKIKELRSKLMYETAYIESALDDPEHISLEGYDERLKAVLSYLKAEIGKLKDSYDNGRIRKEGIYTVILGKPNVGKSSLLNYLMGEERAIVTDVAGTTRDTLEETVLLDGVVLNLIDTAGIRNTEDKVEAIGVEKAKDAAKNADMFLFVADASRPMEQEDEDILKELENKKGLVLLNKSDLEHRLTKDMLESETGRTVIEISAKNKEGIETISGQIRQMFSSGEISNNKQLYITNIRHKEALEDAYKSLALVSDSIEAGMPQDFYSVDLMDAYESLGRIIGESLEDDLADQIFSSFCMGK